MSSTCSAKNANSRFTRNMWPRKPKKTTKQGKTREMSEEMFKALTISSLIIACAALGSCANQVVVTNNCPAWVEVGTISLSDSRPTKQWMAAYETNRQRECK